MPNPGGGNTKVEMEPYKPSGQGSGIESMANALAPFLVGNVPDQVKNLGLRMLARQRERGGQATMQALLEMRRRFGGDAGTLTALTKNTAFSVPKSANTSYNNLVNALRSVAERVAATEAKRAPQQQVSQSGGEAKYWTKQAGDLLSAGGGFMSGFGGG